MCFHVMFCVVIIITNNNNNNNIWLVTLAEHTSDHGKQTNSSTKEKKRGSMTRKLLGANAKSYRLKLKLY